jgi:hypothetical protein
VGGDEMALDFALKNGRQVGLDDSAPDGTSEGVRSLELRQALGRFSALALRGSGRAKSVPGEAAGRGGQGRPWPSGGGWPVLPQSAAVLEQPDGLAGERRFGYRVGLRSKRVRPVRAALSSFPSDSGAGDRV